MFLILQFKSSFSYLIYFGFIYMSYFALYKYT